MANDRPGGSNTDKSKQQVGGGNFANDPQRAGEAGKKGGQHSHDGSGRSQDSMNRPIAYTPGVEVREADEDKTISALIDALLKISNTTYSDGHHALRSVHAKSHAILTGTLCVLPRVSGVRHRLLDPLSALPRWSAPKPL